VKYWFKKTGDELVQELAERVDEFQDYVLRSNLASQWRKNEAFYENRIFGGSISNDILDIGDVGEEKALTFNHYRNIIRHMLNNLTAKDPAYDVSAANTDVASRQAARLGDDLVSYYYRTKRIKKHMSKMAEGALVRGDHYISTEFNPSIGRLLTTTDNGRMIREGDFDPQDLSAWDVFFEHPKASFEDWVWATFRTRRNKYDLAALFPNKKREILSDEISLESDPYCNFMKDVLFSDASDDIYVYSTYHIANNAMPKGKYVLWAGDKEHPIPLYEKEESLYREKLPIFKLSPAHYLGTSFGFTEANTLRAPQMLLTKAISSMATNMSMGAVNSIWTPKNSGLTVAQIATGMNLLQSDVKPEVLQLYKENPNLINMFELCVAQMETLSGQNAVIRGNVKETPNLKSGVALATVINQAQQYSQALEQSYFDTFEDLMSFLLEVLQTTASTERVFQIAGKTRRSTVRSFTKDNLKGAGRVVVNRTNPISKQPAGKVEIATELLKTGNITPQQYFEVIDTGNLRSATESDEKLSDYIADCKEKLLEGQALQPVPGVNHQLFVQEIHSLLMDLNLTQDPEKQHIVQNVTNLINGHMELLRNGDEIASLIYGGQAPMPKEIDTTQVQEPQSAPSEPVPATGPEGPTAQNELPPDEQMPVM
jgi:hypothetical protein